MFIHSFHDIPLKSEVFLYGTGQFGMHIKRKIVKERNDIVLKGFLDSFNDGGFDELTVTKIDNHTNTKALILVTSLYWQEIIYTLKERGFENYNVVSMSILDGSSEITLLSNFEYMHYIPYRSASHSYLIDKKSHNVKVCELGLPIPPQELWANYGSSVEQYLEGGKYHVHLMFEALKKNTIEVKEGSKILDFSCAAGRMTRWLKPLLNSSEIWGSDISAEHITWCKNYLSPPFHFLTNTTIPHLPFEDRYFDFIYAGSVFTHIDDLADAWLLELSRVLNKNGIAYLTIHDKETIKELKGSKKGSSLSMGIRKNQDFQNYSKKEFEMFTVGRSINSQVFYDVNYFVKMIEVFFKVVDVVIGGYGYQTAVIFQKKA
ncbi:MAG: class I SAM-dependent methyltransferase [Nitrospinae bacterium]|nr:class I SAM-dependent methyltransferase [Nitrospinota bacterium]